MTVTVTECAPNSGKEATERRVGRAGVGARRIAFPGASGVASNSSVALVAPCGRAKAAEEAACVSSISSGSAEPSQRHRPCTFATDRRSSDASTGMKMTGKSSTPRVSMPPGNIRAAPSRRTGPDCPSLHTKGWAARAGASPGESCSEMRALSSGGVKITDFTTASGRKGGRGVATTSAPTRRRPTRRDGKLAATSTVTDPTATGGIVVSVTSAARPNRCAIEPSAAKASRWSVTGRRTGAGCARSQSTLPPAAISSSPIRARAGRPDGPAEGADAP